MRKIGISSEPTLTEQVEGFVKYLHWAQHVDWVLLNGGQVVEIGSKDERVKTKLDSDGSPKLTNRDLRAARRTHSPRVPF